MKVTVYSREDKSDAIVANVSNKDSRFIQEILKHDSSQIQELLREIIVLGIQKKKKLLTA